MAAYTLLSNPSTLYGAAASRSPSACTFGRRVIPGSNHSALSTTSAVTGRNAIVHDSKRTAVLFPACRERLRQRTRFGRPRWLNTTTSSSASDQDGTQMDNPSASEVAASTSNTETQKDGGEFVAAKNPGKDPLRLAISRLRDSLPFVTRNDISPNLEYTSISSTFVGGEQYIETMKRWEREVPESLSDFKYEIIHFMQPGPQHVIVRWKVTWSLVPEYRALQERLDQLNQEIERDIETLKAPSNTIKTPYGQYTYSTREEVEQFYIRVSQEKQTSAKAAIVLAESLLQAKSDTDPIALSALSLIAQARSELDSVGVASSALNDTIRNETLKKPEGNIAMQMQKNEIESKLNRAIGFQKTVEEGRMQVNSIGEATREIYGSASIFLDKNGQVYKHTELVDFEPVHVADSEQKEEYTEMLLGNLYMFCVAHRPLDINKFIWNFKVIKLMALESVKRNPEVSDEMSLLDDEQMDLLVNVLLIFPTILFVAISAYMFNFVFVQVPEILEQIKHLDDPFY